MAAHPITDLSRRERQIIEFLFRHGRPATVAQVQRGIANAPSYSAVRTLLSILETKGHVRHREEGRRYLYEATQPRDAAGRSALRRLVRTFFGGSTDQAMAALLDISRDRLSPVELDRLAELVENARREGR